MADVYAKNAESRFTKKDFRGVFWRSFTLLGSMNYERMEALGFLYAILPLLRKIYKDKPEKLKEAMHRHMAAFNMTVAPSPFVMGISTAMEESANDDPDFDPSTINAIKVSLMGPLSGIGDTFFWGIIRILACALAIGFAQEGNIVAPFILLLVFNVPNFVTRWVTLKLGYEKGSALLTDMMATGKMQLFTHCAGIIGAMSIGCMIAMWVSISCPLQFTIAGSEIVIQDYLNQIMPKLLPLAFTMGIFRCVKKKWKVTYIIAGIVVIGFILGILGIVAV